MSAQTGPRIDFAGGADRGGLGSDAPRGIRGPGAWPAPRCLVLRPAVSLLLLLPPLPSSLGSQDSGIRPGPIARAPPARLSTRSSRPPETVPEGPAAGQRHTQVVRDPVPSLAGVPPAFLRGAPGAPPAQHVCVGSVANQRRARCQVPKGSRSARICEAQISGVSTARQGARATRGAAPARSGRARNDSRRPVAGITPRYQLSPERVPAEYQKPDRNAGHLDASGLPGETALPWRRTVQGTVRSVGRLGRTRAGVPVPSAESGL